MTSQTAAVVDIADADDPRLDDYRTLRDPELRKRYEGSAGVFIAEGPAVVRALLTSRYPVRSLLCDLRRARELAPDAAARGAPTYAVERDLLFEVVAFPAHQGALACGRRLPPRNPAEVIAGASRVVLLEAMNDHENMGAIFRTARGLGADAVLLGPRCADPLYRRCVRVSMGHVLHVPHAPVADVPSGMELLADAGFTTVALTPSLTARPISTLDRARPLALLLGAEGPGLQPTTLSRADVQARIPMAAGVDSLNVSAAAAIALHALRP